MTLLPGARNSLRGLMYAFFAASGFAAVFVPSPSLEALLGLITYVWSGFMLAGGLLGSLGSFTDRWLGELLAAPLLTSALVVYGLALWLTSPTNATRVAIGALMIAISFGLGARLRDVYALSRVARSPTQKE